jgi:DNA-binding XRE family transcriptional regulator
MRGEQEDERAGRLLREIRRRSHQTQAQIASTAQVPRTDVMKIEAGRVAEVRLERTR